ncbi:MAG: hypothetical protein JWL94_2366, partial [Microbacteriaceae bacterium]|nr:hypothetical protein [Microbacteriaceae bacterium]
LSGEEAQETVRFAIDGAQHEIDLTAAHAAELRNQLARYVAHGRRLPGGSARRSSKPAAAGRAENQKMIRQWARSSGFSLSSRGAISRHIKEAYDAAQG